MKLRQTQCCVVFALILHCTIFFNIASRFSESNDIAEELQQDNASRFALPKSSNKPNQDAHSNERNAREEKHEKGCAAQLAPVCATACPPVAHMRWA